MTQGLIIFWSAIGVAVLSSIVTLFVSFFSSKVNTTNLSKQIEKEVGSIEKSIKVNIDSVAKELKTKVATEALSKYRQEWINQLRDRTTQFVSKSSELFERCSNIDDLDEKQLDESLPSFDGNKKRRNSQMLFQLKELYHYLELLLNPNEEKSQKILLSCNDIIVFCTSIKDSIPQLLRISDAEWDTLEKKLSNYQIELTKNAQDVLKEEWELIKKSM